MIRGYKNATPRHHSRLGMTEMTPLGTLCNWRRRCRTPARSSSVSFETGTPLPSCSFGRPRTAPRRGRADDGEWKCAGRWPRILQRPRPTYRFTEDAGSDGDIVTIDPRCIELTDRCEGPREIRWRLWISSVALETALMGHPCVPKPRGWRYRTNGTSALASWSSNPARKRPGTI
jgi:hypothetical protein